MHELSGPRDRRAGEWALPVAGAAALAIPTALLLAWIASFGRVNAGQAARVEALLSLAPGFMRDPVVLTFAALACAIAGMLFGIACVVRGRPAIAAVGFAEFALGAALAGLLLFSLM